MSAALWPSSIHERFAMKSVFACCALVLSGLFVAACSSEHSHDDDAGTHKSSFASCQAIMDGCHEVDIGEGPVNACHELAHADASEESCAAKKDECLATCKAAAVDAGPTDSGSDSAKDSGDHNHDHDH